MQLIKPKSARKESACVACSAARKQRVSDNMNASSAPRGRCEGERWPGTQRLRDRPRYTHNAPSLTSGLSSHWVFSKVGLLQAPSQPINPLCRSSTPHQTSSHLTRNGVGNLKISQGFLLQAWTNVFLDSMTSKIASS